MRQYFAISLTNAPPDPVELKPEVKPLLAVPPVLEVIAPY